MIEVDDNLFLDPAEFRFTAVRARGPGGQHVNTTSSAVQLRFDVRASGLPEPVKQRLLASSDRRISSAGVVVIKAQSERSQEQNRRLAVERLAELVRKANWRPARRVATQPTKASRKRRLDGKIKRGRIKRLRARVRNDDT